MNGIACDDMFQHLATASEHVSCNPRLLDFKSKEASLDPAGASALSEKNIDLRDFEMMALIATAATKRLNFSC